MGSRESQVAMSKLIREGDCVIVRMHDDQSSHMLMVKGEQKLFRKRLLVDELVGAPYGSIFQFDGKNLALTRVPDEAVMSLDPAAVVGANDTTSDSVLESAAVAAGSSSSNTEVIKGDNSTYTDTNTAQKLGIDDIETLKDSGASGQSIIAALIANSDTWNNKTEFAQEKWLKKKQQRYIKRMRIIETTPLTLCDVYHTKTRDKICGLRADSLAHIVSHSGAYAGARVLVVESCIGLVVGAIANRLQGAGSVLAAYVGQQPHFELVDSMNLADDITGIIQPFSTQEMASAARDVQNYGFAAASAVPDVPDMPLPDGPVAEAAAAAALQRPPKRHNTTGRKAWDLPLVRHQLRVGFNSLVVACRYNVLPIVKKALHLLAPSSPFVLYCEFVDPLLECYQFMVKHTIAVRVTVSDTWMREFQTLPGRVHPQMYMTTSSGYILSGTYVGGIAAAEQAEVEARAQSAATAGADASERNRSNESGDVDHTLGKKRKM